MNEDEYLKLPIKHLLGSSPKRLTVCEDYIVQGCQILTLNLWETKHRIVDRRPTCGKCTLGIGRSNHLPRDKQETLCGLKYHRTHQPTKSPEWWYVLGSYDLVLDDRFMHLWGRQNCHICEQRTQTTLEEFFR